MRTPELSVIVMTLFLAVVSARAFVLDDDPTNAAANMGERLFLETRFSQFFFTNCGGDVNAIQPGVTNADFEGGAGGETGDTNLALEAGDPVMATLKTIYGRLPGPFAGMSMNCRQCHLVNEMRSSRRPNFPGNRTYCDFSTRSAIPDIGDGAMTTPRNSPTLVNGLRGRSGPLFLHWDGQFAAPQQLVIETLTGRNYGWRPTEYATAVHHIANVIRYDNGRGALAGSRYGGGYSYATVFTFPPDGVSRFYRLPYEYWLGDLAETNADDPFYVSDEEIVQSVASLIVQYLGTLAFAQDTNGNYVGSPYDVFLIKNGLPQKPEAGESPLQYGRRLLGLIEGLNDPQFVIDARDGSFSTHKQRFQFGPLELEGLRIFLQTNSVGATPAGPAFVRMASSGGIRTSDTVGNCVVCHPPPEFTDFIFHNTGASQADYDSVHGDGAFNRVQIPDLTVRGNDYDAYLPPTAGHPAASGRFRLPPTKPRPDRMDLGLWNVFENPDYPAPQAALRQTLTNEFPAAKTASALLECTIGAVRTPTLRDLGHSQPYLHTGRMRTIEAVIRFDREFAQKAREGKVRNGDPQLKNEWVDEKAVVPLAAFLRALNEDYTD